MAAPAAPEQPSQTPEPMPSNSAPLNYREAFQGREIVSKFIDPCEQASKESMDCLNRHSYDRDKCLTFFQAYRDCKGAWLKQRRDDRRAGK